MREERRFSFFFSGLPGDTFKVVGFSGREAISELYAFTIELVSSKADLDMEDAAEGMATLVIHRQGEQTAIHGLVSRFEQFREVNGYVFYKALLRPRLWGLTLVSHNQVFLDKTAPEFLAEILEASGMLTSMDYEFRLTGTYPQREFVCQFGETHYAFFARWLEREGMYYFFEQTNKGDKLIIADNAIAHAADADRPPLRYKDVRGLEAAENEEICFACVTEQNALPRRVVLKDYNYRYPALMLQGDADIDDVGMGELYFFGENIADMDEARRQAAIRAQEAKCRKNRVKGRSMASFLRPGVLFTLAGHYRRSANRQYLPLVIEHRGEQTGYLMSGLGPCLSDREARNFYLNSFEAVGAEIQYRHPRTTPWPRFHGVMHAAIDAEGEGEYAELDEYGRYKVRLPFDVADRPGGKASSWIRMAEPYGGQGHGMHFPLLKGAEVLLTFMDGDPDQPVIAAAVPNMRHHSVVKNTNAPANAIRSAGGNMLVMGDKKGAEFIGMYSEEQSSGMVLGSSGYEGGGISMNTEGDFNTFVAGAMNSATLGVTNTVAVGGTNSVSVGINGDLSATATFEANLGPQISFAYSPNVELGESGVSLHTQNDISALESVTISGGANAVATGLVQKAKKALALGLSGCIMAGAGSMMTAAPYEGGILEKASTKTQDPVFGTGIGSLVVGSAGVISSLAWARSIVKDFNDANEGKKAASMTFDKHGAAITVNSAVGENPEFSASVKVEGEGGAAQQSSVKITAGGDEICLNNKDNATLKLQQGTTIELKANQTSITLNGQGVRLHIPNMQFKVDNHMKINEQGFIELG